jgi:hypothetical protein
MSKACSDQADFHVKAAMQASVMSIGSGDVEVGDLHGPSKVLASGERFARAVEDGIHGSHGDNPNRDGLTLVPRPGGPDPNDLSKSVPSELAHMVSRPAQTE